MPNIYKKAHFNIIMPYGITCSHAYVTECGTGCRLVIKIKKDSRPRLAALHYFMVKVAFSLLIAFSTSLEGSVIEVKPAAPVPVDTTVSLKA